MVMNGLEQAQALMREAGVHPQAIAVFAHSYHQLASGETGLLNEADLEPVRDLPRLGDLEVDWHAARAAMAATVAVKLNGGLGTSMGMDRAKSLLEVRPGRSFLDIIAEQVLALREHLHVPLPVIFMNSFRTSADTLKALAAYPELPVTGLPLEFLQNREPKLLSADLTPVSWPADPDLEWCPPGHGDIYTALDASGLHRHPARPRLPVSVRLQRRQPRRPTGSAARRLVLRLGRPVRRRDSAGGPRPTARAGTSHGGGRTGNW